MAGPSRFEGNPLESPIVVSKRFSLEEFRCVVQRCRACGNPVTIRLPDLVDGRYRICDCGRGCFEIEIRLVHTIERHDRVL